MPSRQKAAVEEGAIRMAANTPEYFSYLLRLWVVRVEHVLIWRASLENPHTQEIVGFESIQKLAEYLERKTHLDNEDELD
jgi:hypothetical protein